VTVVSTSTATTTTSTIDKGWDVLQLRPW
jgi:hypothetical protein